jgi:hypothetical protein
LRGSLPVVTAPGTEAKVIIPEIMIMEVILPEGMITGSRRQRT